MGEGAVEGDSFNSLLFLHSSKKKKSSKSWQT